MFEDDDLANEDIFKVIYTGSIRKANNLELIINAAKYVNEKSNGNIKFIIFGDGVREKIGNRCKTENICNVIFKGQICKNIFLI